MGLEENSSANAIAGASAACRILMAGLPVAPARRRLIAGLMQHVIAMIRSASSAPPAQGRLRESSSDEQIRTFAVAWRTIQPLEEDTTEGHLSKS
jgi:hypothetical protein